MNDEDVITVEIDGFFYDLGTIEKPYTAEDLGNFFIEVGVLLKTPVEVLESMIEVEGA